MLTGARLRSRPIVIIVTVTIAVSAFVLPWTLSEFYLGLVTLGLVYGLFAFGLDIVWGRAGVVSIGHAVFFGVGAYGVAIANAHGVSQAIGGVVGIVTAVLLSIAVGGAGLRRRATPSTMAILTLGVTLLAAQIATAWVGVTGGTDGLLIITNVAPGAYFWLCFGAASVIVALCQVFVFRAPLGNRLVAVRLNPRRAAHLGIAVQRHALLAVVLGAAVSAFAGVLAAPLITLVSPVLVGVALSAEVLIWVALGGKNSLLGPFIGAMAVTLGQTLLSDVSVDYYLLVLGLLFVIVVIVAPEGLAGLWRRGLEVAPAWSLRRRRPAPAAPDVIAAAPSETALSVTGMVKRFGAVPAVDGVSFDVRTGEIVCLVGPNGAGKTTLLDLISGDQDVDAGTVILLGRDVSHSPVHIRSQLGLARTFQVPSLFPELTAAEHLTLARQQSGEAGTAAYIDDRFDGALAGVRARELSLGDRRALEIAVALARRPRLILLDEPAAGLARDEAERLAHTLLSIRDELGCAIVAVEHDMEIVRILADRVIVLHQGAELCQGSIAEVSADARVRDAYLGAA